MTSPTVPDAFSVESYVESLRSSTDNGGLYARALGNITGIATYGSKGADDRIKDILNVIAAVDQVETERRQAATGLTYSREQDEADDPTPVSPARGWHAGAMVTGGELVDEAGTLSAAIHFSNVQREAALHAGRISPERLRTATLDLLHEQARAEDAERAQGADVREGEQGRITNPKLAHFLAEKEEKRRVARHFLGLEESAKHYPAVETLTISDETIAEAAGMEERDRAAGGPPWEVPGHPDHALPGGWHHGQIR